MRPRLHVRIEIYHMMFAQWCSRQKVTSINTYDVFTVILNSYKEVFKITTVTWDVLIQRRFTRIPQKTPPEDKASKTGGIATEATQWLCHMPHLFHGNGTSVNSLPTSKNNTTYQHNRDAWNFLSKKGSL